MSAHDPEVDLLEAIYGHARTLAASADPLVVGQYKGLLGRVTALLAIKKGELPDLSEAAASSFPSMRLDGMVALVTGASGGLGSLAACAFAAAGADVVVAGRSQDKCDATSQKVHATGRRALSVVAEITDGAQVKALTEAAIKKFGRIDILFNNAGITSPKPFLESSEEEWLKVIDVNVRGTFLCTRAVAAVMRDQKFGRIINMGSIMSKGAIANRSAYITSKAAIAHLTQALAFEFGPFGITVNAIGPTVIETDLNRDLIKNQPQLYDNVLKRTPLGRLGVPEDIAGALVFLASPAAAFITGQTLYVDGGYTAG